MSRLQTRTSALAVALLTLGANPACLAADSFPATDYRDVEGLKKDPFTIR